VTLETHITIEPIPANPGYTADITGHLSDPENDPRGMGPTREAAALDLARQMIEEAENCGAHPCICLAIAAALRVKGFPEAADYVEGIA
jgi:hypothetical protein